MMQGTNRLLDALSEESRREILGQSTQVELPTQTPIHQPEEVPAHVYFMTSGVASVVATTENGSAVEVGMTGREGGLGLFSCLGPSLPLTTCVIQSSGRGYRIPLREFRRLFEQRADIHGRTLEYFQAHLFTLGQIAGCHRLHEAEERLARWLLMAADRAGADTLDLTHEYLAEMLGSRRSTVSIAAGLLQRAGMIEYSRGRIAIIDRDRLEQAACSCYPLVTKIFHGLYRKPLKDVEAPMLEEA